MVLNLFFVNLPLYDVPAPCEKGKKVVTFNEVSKFTKIYINKS